MLSYRFKANNGEWRFVDIGYPMNDIESPGEVEINT